MLFWVYLFLLTLVFLAVSVCRVSVSTIYLKWFTTQLEYPRPKCDHHFSVPWFNGDVPKGCPFKWPAIKHWILVIIIFLLPPLVQRRHGAKSVSFRAFKKVLQDLKGYRSFCTSEFISHYASNHAHKHDLGVTNGSSLAYPSECHVSFGPLDWCAHYNNLQVSLIAFNSRSSILRMFITMSWDICWG